MDDIGITIGHLIVQGFTGGDKFHLRFFPFGKEFFNQPDASYRIQIRIEMGNNRFWQITPDFLTPRILGGTSLREYFISFGQIKQVKN